MRILFLAWRDLAHPLAGGSEVLVDRLADGLVACGHDVELMCGGPTAARTYGVTATGGTYTQYLRAPLRYLRHHRHADLVVDVVNGVPYLAPVWRRRPSICLVNHIHTDLWNLWFPRPVAAVGRGMEARALPLVYGRRLVVAVSPSTASALADLGVPPEQIRIVPNGVDSHEGQAHKSHEPLFVAVGRLVPHKRYDLLLRLWEKVRPLTGGRLVIVGEGPEGDRLRSLAGPGASLPGRVTEEEKRRLLDSSWLMLHPALVEGWGLVVMEAAAHQTPTVGFDVPGVRDSVVGGRSGVLARSEDDFARAWVQLGTHRGEREALGAYARERARELSWPATVNRFLAVADEAVGSERGRAPVIDLDEARRYEPQQETVRGRADAR